ncbi:MAG: T9SS type A sorting domain-containing protein [Bacteroidota bacterium]
MKKIILLSLIFVISTFFVSAQSYTSAANGNWTNPTTWSPPGIPVTFTDVTINHAVVLNTDFALNSGEIYIGSSGSLIEDISDRNFVIYGGEMTNNGIFTISNFWNDGGDFTNNGTSNIRMLLNESYLMNTGLIDQVDSLMNNDELYNYSGTINVMDFASVLYIENDGLIAGTNFFNDGGFDNYDEIDFENFTNADTAYNEGWIYFNNFTNIGYFDNYEIIEGSHDFTNVGEFNNYSLFSIDNDFLNVDSTNHEAYFYTEGLVIVGNNWLNIDTIDGTNTGQFCIGNNTGNDGDMIGDFDFCDNTPPGSPPYIDYNTGTIDVNIVYCITPCGTNINNISDNRLLNIYPNPVTDHAFIELSSFDYPAIFELYDITGQMVESINIESNITLFQRNNLKSGLYFYSVKSEEKIIGKGKIVIQ